MYTAKESTNQNMRPVRDAAEDTTDSLRDVAGKAGSQIRHFFDAAGNELDHARQVVVKQVHTHPLQSGLMALGAGFLLGLLVRR